jgi:hypothetical protein
VAAGLLGLRGGIPPMYWKSVSCERRVLLGKCVCVGPITHPEESHRVWWA